MMRLPVQYLGQSGWKIIFPDLTMYIDPYLSNSVQELDSCDLKRLRPIPFLPDQVCDADIVLITHNHLDHCDPHTLPQISMASPQARFIGPFPVIKSLLCWGIEASRTMLASEQWFALVDKKINICAIPAAHPEVERDANGNLACVGFLIEYDGKRLYVAGDTSVEQEMVDVLKQHGGIHVAILPVNEHNYFLQKRGIIGNMSVREAFQFAVEIGAKHVIAVHWDMFKVNSVFPEEIRLLHNLLDPGFTLALNPSQINLRDIDVSIIIRTLNESKHLDSLLTALEGQKTNGLRTEIIIVDSGSTDHSLEIARAHGCHIEHIARSEFTFGRSLNQGCDAAAGDILVIISGHCVPADEFWLQRICRPIIEGQAQYAYGRQLGGADSFLSEHRIFDKYFPETSKIPQEGFYCNNANSAIHRDTWLNYRYDEELTGLEDLDLARRLVNDGGKIAYVADAAIYHYHAELWSQIRRRFEREAIALRKIMPQFHVSLWDSLRYFVTSCYKDITSSRSLSCNRKSLMDVIRYRWNQYIGSWRGNNEHRKLSHEAKEKYFYP